MKPLIQILKPLVIDDSKIPDILISGLSINSKTVKTVMTRKLIFTCPETPNTEAKKLMIENQIRHLPVFSDEHLVGIISMRDVFNV